MYQSDENDRKDNKENKNISINTIANVASTTNKHCNKMGKNSISISNNGDNSNFKTSINFIVNICCKKKEYVMCWVLLSLILFATCLSYAGMLDTFWQNKNVSIVIGTFLMGMIAIVAIGIIYICLTNDSGDNSNHEYSLKQLEIGSHEKIMLKLAENDRIGDWIAIEQEKTKQLKIEKEEKTKQLKIEKEEKTKQLKAAYNVIQNIDLKQFEEITVNGNGMILKRRKQIM